MRAHKKGVNLIVREIEWDENNSFLGKSLPVIFDTKAVDDTDIDEEHLAAVLVSHTSTTSSS